MAVIMVAVVGYRKQHKYTINHWSDILSAKTHPLHSANYLSTVQIKFKALKATNSKTIFCVTFCTHFHTCVLDTIRRTCHMFTVIVHRLTRRNPDTGECSQVSSSACE